MGKNVVFLMLIMAMLLTVVAGGVGKTIKNAAKGASGQVMKDNSRKTMEENEGDQPASDCDQEKLVNNLHDALGVTDKGLQLGKDRGIEFTDQKTTEENGGEQACDQGQGQNLEDNIVDGARNIVKQPSN